MLEGNIPMKVTPPQLREHLKRLLQGDGARGVQQQTLQAGPTKTTGQIKQPIQISRGATPGELLAPPLQDISAGNVCAVSQGRGLRQCNPDSHSSSRRHSSAKSWGASSAGGALQTKHQLIKGRP